MNEQAKELIVQLLAGIGNSIPQGVPLQWHRVSGYCNDPVSPFGHPAGCESFQVAFLIGPNSTLFDATRLSTVKRLAIAVLLDDPGAGDALIDAMQEAGLLPSTLEIQKRQFREFLDTRIEDLPDIPATKPLTLGESLRKAEATVRDRLRRMT